MVSLFSPFGFLGIPPSRLGFVCKPDMPPHINILFRARPPLEFIKKPEKQICRSYDGVNDTFRNYKALFEKEAPPERKEHDPAHLRRLKIIADKTEKNKAENKEKLKEWNPKQDEKIQGDPYKSLFVYRINYDTSEKKLKKEFEIYGQIKRIRLVKDLAGKSLGYAFIEYEHKNDFKNAYKRADRKRIDNKRVYVDYERGRTENNWKPRRLGGGKGDSRRMPSWLEREVKQIKDQFPEISKKYKKIEFLNKKRSRSNSKSNEGKLSVESNRVSNDNNNQNIKVKVDENPSIRMRNDMGNNNHIQPNFAIFSENTVDSVKVEEINYTHIIKNEVNEESKDFAMNDEKKEKKTKKDKKNKKDKKKKEKKEKKDKKEKKEKKKKSSKSKKKKKEKDDDELEIGEIA